MEHGIRAGRLGLLVAKNLVDELVFNKKEQIWKSRSSTSQAHAFPFTCRRIARASKRGRAPSA
jgi:hypothetical protein